ncbi:MAG: hypothetical protein ACRD0K_16790 [Egibacteraceae bacterium]
MPTSSVPRIADPRVVEVGFEVGEPVRVPVSGQHDRVGRPAPRDEVQQAVT